VVRGLVEISSSSRAEISDVLLEFDWGTDMNRATQDVREKLDVVFLPEEVGSPLILRYDPSLDPMIRLGLTSDSLGPLELRSLAEDLIKRELEKLAGVAAVKVKGGEEAEIRVAVDAAELDLLNISMERILQRLASENVNVAGGQLQEGESEFIIRTLNEFRSIGEIADIVIDYRGGSIISGVNQPSYPHTVAGGGIRGGQGVPIRLRDIASVTRRGGERTTITRVAGRESVGIDIHKESDINPIVVSSLVKKCLFGDKGKKKVHPGKSGRKEKRGPKPLAEVLTERIKIHFLSDQAEFIRLSVNQVRSAAIMGGILAVIVLLLFLGQMRDTLVVAVVIPVSLVCAFAAMHITKVSLNIMSLGGLALGIGMMVDNAIVVIESIHRRRESGEEPTSAAVIGTRTVGGAVTASTLTTVVVFFPIVFVSGVAGQVFGDMALTVIIALSVSLLVALFFIPMLIARGTEKGRTARNGSSDWNPPGMKAAEPPRELRNGITRWRRLHIWLRILTAPVVFPYLLIRFVIELLVWLGFRACFIILIVTRWMVFRLVKPSWKRTRGITGGVGVLFRRGIEGLTESYLTLLNYLLTRPWLVILPLLLLCLYSFGLLLPRLGGELIPSISQGTFDIEYTLPVGTPLERTAQIVLPVEQKLAGMSEVRKVSSRIGGELMSAEQSSRGPHNAVQTVMLQTGGDLEAREARVTRAVREMTCDIPSLGMLITHPTLFTFKQPIEVVLKGDDLPALHRLGREVRTHLEALPMLVDVESSIHPGHPEVGIRFDRDRLARLGLTAQDAAERVKAAILGKVPTRFREEEQRIDIRVQLVESDRRTVDDLIRLVVNPGQAVPVTLSDVSTIEIREGPSEIRRVGGARAAVISASVRGSDLKSADTAIRGVLAGMGLTEGYDYTISGQYREMEGSLASLRSALLLAIFLVYVVMASQFESLRHPLLILVTIPLAMAGVVPILWGAGMPLSVMVFLGLIVLTGIVVNNSIVLVDYTNQMLRSGKGLDESVTEAARARLRPILMTSITTIMALLPMALGVGEGVEIRRPMAVTVIFGLAFATLVTLIVIPVLYRLVTRAASTSSSTSDPSSKVEGIGTNL